MQTYSHFIITAALDRANKHRAEPVPVKTRALLLGSIVPDMALFVLTFAYFIDWRFISRSDEFIFGPTYDALYFTNPLWLGSHNLFHAPLMIALYAAIGYVYGVRRGRAWGLWLLWFAVGCGLHSVIDIFTHANDGPLLFFPFDWQTRFSAPISYWDPRFGGREFAIFEHTLDLILIGYLTLTWWRGRKRGQQVEAGAN